MKLKMFGALLVASLMSPIVMKAAAADVIKEPEWGPVEEVESYTVGPGIKYTKYIYPDKPVILWFTEIDLTNPYNKIEQAQSRDAVPDVQRWDLPTFYKQNSRPGHNENGVFKVLIRKRKYLPIPVLRRVWLPTTDCRSTSRATIRMPLMVSQATASCLTA